MNNIKEDLSDDPRCRITPVQQIAAACSGALITSALGRFAHLIPATLFSTDFPFFIE